jgi:AhpD family alkylhydroperoxidase
MGNRQFRRPSDEELMDARLDYAKAAPKGFKALFDLQSYVNQCGLEHDLLELVKLRASQLNGCAFCIAMHTHDARKSGMSEDRMHLLNAWHETPASLYSPRERAALAWTEALTFIAGGHAPDDVYRQVREQFSDKELADLSLTIATINSWNRLAIGFRVPPQLET